MKKIILLLIFIPFISFGQTKYDRHDELIAEAHSLKEEGSCKLAIEKFIAALEILKPESGRTFFSIAECAILNDEIELADKWIRKGVTLGGASKNYLLSFKGFTDIQNKEFYLEILNGYDQLRQEYFLNIDNIELYLQIEKLAARDQFVRKADLYLAGYSDADYQNAADGLKKAREEKDSVATEKFKKILFLRSDEKHKETVSELRKRVDSLNIARLMEITEKHGWHNEAWIILWHQRGTFGEDNYIWNYFKPMIDKEIEEGKVSRNFWSAFYLFQDMMKNGETGTIQLGEEAKKDDKKK